MVHTAFELWGEWDIFGDASQRSLVDLEILANDMADRYADYPPEISPEQQEHLATTVKNWSIEHGLTVRPAPSFVAQDLDPHGILATNAPVTLFPSPFPRACFEQAKSLQKAYNELYAAISNDEDWLENIMREYDYISIAFLYDPVTSQVHRVLDAVLSPVTSLLLRVVPRIAPLVSH